MFGYIWREIKTKHSTRTDFYLPFVGLRLIQPIYQFSIDAFCDYGFLGKRKEIIRFWDNLSSLYRTLHVIKQNQVSCVYLGASVVYNFHPKMFCSLNWEYNRLWGNKVKKVLITIFNDWEEKTHWQSNEVLFNFGYTF